MKTISFRVNSKSIKIKNISGTFLPSKRSLLLANFITTLDLTNKKILDIGCGSGFLSILCAKLGASEIVSLDINPAAIFQTKENFKINHLPKIKPILKISNVFDELNNKKWKNRFDFIISNPPGLPSSVIEKLDSNKFPPWIWNASGKDGRLVTDKIINEGSGFLKSGGQILICHSSRLNFEITKKMLNNIFPHWSIAVKRRFKLEKHFLKFINFWQNRKKELVFQKGNSFFEELILIQAIK